MILNSGKACKSNTTQNHKYELINQTEENPKPYLEAAIDWYRVSFQDRSEYFRRDVISRVIGMDAAYVVKNGRFTDYEGDRGYQHKIQGEYGQQVLWRESEEGYDVRVNLTGDFLSSKWNLVQFARFAQWCEDFGGHCTRLDLNVTDHLKRIDWQDIDEACRDGNYSGVWDAVPLLKGRGGKFIEATAYLGSRRSESFTRIYETDKKHGYRANRIEVEFKGKKARETLKNFLRKYSNFERQKGFDYQEKPIDDDVNNKLARWVGYVVVGQIDFVDKSNQYGNGSLAKCPRLPWWQKFIEGIGGIVKITVERIKTSLTDNFNWIKRQVSKTLAVYSKGLGEQDAITLIKMLIDSASLKLNDKDKMRIAILNKEGISALVSNSSYG